jgi:ATP-binding cassette subfamily B protein
MSRTFLDLLAAAERERLLAAGQEATFGFGEVLIRQGQLNSDLFIITRGRVRVVVSGKDGQEEVLSSLERGDIVGEMSLLSGAPCGATVRASGEVAAVRISYERARALLAERPTLREWLERSGQRRVLHAFLRRQTALGMLSPETVLRLMETLVPVEVAAGTTLIRQGDPPGPLYLVQAGRLQVHAQVGAEQRVLAYLRDGDFFGERSLLMGEPRKATVETLSPSLLLRLDPGPYSELLRTSPELRSSVEQMVATYHYDREATLPLDFAQEPVPAQALGRKAPTPTPEETPFGQEGHFIKRPGRGRWLFPLIRQVDEMDCGVACLAMICRYYGRHIPLWRLRLLAHTEVDGTSLRHLCHAARELGLAARTVKASWRHLDELPLPAIIHWRNFHWVVLVAVERRRVRIADPAIGLRWLTREEVQEHWNGYAGLFDFTDRFADAPEGRPSLGWLLGALRPYRGVLAQSLGLALLVSAIVQLQPILTQVVVDRVIVEGALDTLRLVLLGMGVSLVLLILAALLQGYLLAFIAVRVDAATLDHLTERLLRLPLAYFLARRTGDIQRRLDGVRQVRELVVTLGVAAALAVVQLLLTVGLMLLYSPSLTLVFLGVAPLYAGLMVFASRFMQPLFDRLEESYGQYRSYQLDAIKGIEAVKVTGAEPAFRGALLARYLELAQHQFRADCATIAYQGGVRALALLSAFLFLWLGARMAIQGELTIGGFVAFSALVTQANVPILTVLLLWDRLQLARVLLHRLTDVFDSPPEQEAERLLPVPTLSGALEVRGVTFRYGGPESTPILRNIHFQVRPGQRLALVGRSGSGKSTLVKLLVGLVEPTEGHILYDGLDLRTLRYRDLRRHVGYVMQDTHLFVGSVLENIAGSEEMDLDRVIAAARAANAHEFIQRLPLGYDTRVGETGVQLSGGQRQRVAVARALYRRPPLLIFDEATSALDAESEQVIQESLDTLFRGHTLILIAHRLSTVRHADRILVLERGEVVEEGSHAELMQRHGVYFYLVSRQIEA